ncbi:MAG: tRNA (N(6)-L-threonylcarbamoyladenosine(37)-C(2))-methylthiotransferase MtaB [Christensenellaceae bacterium]|nr:tRNA (N(6)-L-threonylcarbamoyladenosine(37)-C(2))-methylthiotransferase MtaB [Christensenellaceae bacterium]
MKKVYFHTLGCKVNQYDTQAMLEQFLDNGYTYTNNPKDADVYVVNTCTVTSTADKKSLQMANRQKKLSPNCELIIAGCMAQNKGSNLLSTGARLILGTHNRSQIVNLFNRAINENRQIVAVSPLEFVGFENLNIKKHNNHTRAILKIQEGCENNCSYCIIPTVRGPIRSKKLDEIKKEAESLVEAGYKDITVTGINLFCYGKDFEDKKNLLDAIEVLNSIKGLCRLRLSSLEPGFVNERNIKRLKALDKLCPHFHLALQSGSDRILSLMRRRYNTEMYSNAIKMLKESFTDCSFTTDIIVGFPSETEEDFNETLDFVKKIDFMKVHVFPYSPRENTDAALMENQINQSLKKERVSKLIKQSNTQMDIIYKNMNNKTVEVLIEEKTSKDRWKGFTPQYMSVELIGDFISGELVKAKIIGHKNELLYGEKL